MADSIVAQQGAAAANHPGLKEVAHGASDDLFDVIAMLRGARGILAGQRNEGAEVDRLIRQAMERIDQIHSAFDPHI